uniref:DNA polymerase n=1 Tax=Ndongobacter massiliensis TaxID=1871025 RepID=UPI0009308AE7|nr:DNA polymerase [Ndongobacter massiliensis]
MLNLSIDIETYSAIDITKSGLYKYVEDDSFEVLLFAYAVNFGEVKIVDLAQGEAIPKEVIDAVADDRVTKHAYNAAFEYNALKAYGLAVGARTAWLCTMFHAMYLGYPAGLKATGDALGLTEDKAKLSTGKSLIQFFSKPCRATKANGMRTKNLPKHAPERWELFKEYCKQDVVAEMAIHDRLCAFPLPQSEQELWAISDEMNAIGVGVDRELVDSAIWINDALTAEQTVRAQEISGLANPNSTVQILPWLNRYLPEVGDVRKATVAALLDRDDLPEEVREFLLIRQELSKTSVKKYDAMLLCVCKDGRMRGLLQHYGANRTGRWSGRLVQVQNLPRNYLKTLDIAREFTRKRDVGALSVLYGNVTDTLSQLIRTAFIPEEGRKFIVSDYSAIEARVIAWLAGETWVNEVFATHGKIYEATASQMFGVPIEKIKKGNPEYALRQKGKVATLALGYQGGVGALKAMGADKMGLSEEEMAEVKDRWREANPHIVSLWREMEDVAIDTVRTGRTNRIRDRLIFSLEAEPIFGQSFLTITLPSGRKLYYPEPEIDTGNFGNDAIFFMGIGLNRRLTREQTYGGKLTENVVQAIARDCLGTLLLRLHTEYPNDPVVMHIHDEVVLDARKEVSVEEINAVMSRPIDWAPGLILKGAGFESPYYMKD